MTTSLQFACGLLTTAALALAAVAYLRAPLRDLLIELCGNDRRARFWAAFSHVTVVSVPVIAALQYNPSGNNAPALLEIGAQLKLGLAGLVVSILILGQVLARFIPRGSTPINVPQG